MAVPVRCEKCLDEGERSTVNVPQSSITTLMPVHNFYDEDGIYHSHDRNTHGSEWSCSRGHRWAVIKKFGCPDDGCTVRGSVEIRWED